jgi:excisionase family DNA binding protein
MRFLTAKELSVVLSVRVSRIYELTRRRMIPVVRVGERQFRYDPDAIKEWADCGGMAGCKEGDALRQARSTHANK